MFRKVCRRCAPDQFPPASLASERQGGRHVAVRFGRDDCFVTLWLDGERVITPNTHPDPDMPPAPPHVCWPIEAWAADDGWIITEDGGHFCAANPDGDAWYGHFGETIAERVIRGRVVAEVNH